VKVWETAKECTEDVVDEGLDLVREEGRAASKRLNEIALRIDFYVAASVDAIEACNNANRSP
jgi:hypothetical protein